MSWSKNPKPGMRVTASGNRGIGIFEILDVTPEGITIHWIRNDWMPSVCGTNDNFPNGWPWEPDWQLHEAYNISQILSRYEKADPI